MEKLRSLSHRLSRSGDKRPRTESTLSNARCASFGHHNASLTPQVPCASPRSSSPTINALPVDTQGIIITARSGAATEAPPAYTLTGPPPAYSTTRTAAAAAAAGAGAGAEAPPPEQQHACEYTMENMTRDDDPHYFLYLFDTVFLVDDSTSMLGPRWREVRSALRQITPVCTSHDDDGIDIHFMNHRSSENTTTNNNNNSDDGISSQSGGGMARGKARGGYYNITDPLAVDALFQRLRPCGPTHTRGRIEDILEPYFTQLESAENVQDVRPLNLIVITDGMPGPCPRHVNFSGSGFGSGFNGNGEAAAAHNPHLPDTAIVRYARRLDELRAPAWQVGVQFFQVGDDAAATASLRGLDDGLARRHGVRDIVDTLKFGDDDYKTLTAEEILKAVLGAVSRRLDNQSCEREGAGRSGRRASRPLRR